jgi:hypothetical protein
MRNGASATALQLLKETITAVLKLVWNTFKGCLSALFLLLAVFAAWGVWQKGSLSFGTIAVVSFLLLVACAPWVIPRIGLTEKPAPRTIALAGALVAMVCVDFAYSALTYGWKADDCSAPGALFCHGMNLLYSLGGNALIAVVWLGLGALVVRSTIRAVFRASGDTRARLGHSGY